MTDNNAAKIVSVLTSAMQHLSAAESDLIRARMLVRTDATGPQEDNVRDVEGTVRAAKGALVGELNWWDSAALIRMNRIIRGEDED